MSGVVLLLKRRLMSVVLWQALFVLAIIAAFINHYLTVTTMMQPLRFVAMDSRDTFYLSRLGTFEDAKHIHGEIAKMAAETIFNRNPDGFDDLERLERLFNPKTTKRLKEKAERDADTFRVQRIHQKFETGTVRELQVSHNTVLVSVEGEVLRHGYFNQKMIDDSRRVTVFFKLAVNDDMAHNGRYPLVVINYDEKFQN